MDKSSVFHEWRRDWEKERATQSAVSRLREVGGSERDFAFTLHRIAEACFYAKHYDQNKDPGASYRKKIKDETKRLAQLQKAARVIANSARRNDKSLMWSAGLAEVTSGVRITRAEKTEKMHHHWVMENYFSALEAALENRLPEIHGGPWGYRFTLGNLIFDDAISAGRIVSPETMLAFELALYMRYHTAGLATAPTQLGEKMLDEGEPCFSAVAAFCKATFGGGYSQAEIQDDAKRIGDNVRELKKVGLYKWPMGGN